MLRSMLFRVLVLVLLASLLGQSAPTSVQAAAYDLIVEGLEVTQTVQDMNNSLPLVEGKRTFVRVYGRSPNGIVATTAQLRLQKGSTVTTIYPIAPGGPKIYLRPSYSRLIANHAFLFEIPSAYTTGTVTITAEINPSNFWWTPNPIESNYQNNRITRQVTFTHVPTVWIAIGDQPYYFANWNMHYQSTFNDRWMMFKWIKKVYPLNKTQIKFFTMPEVTADYVPNGKGGYKLAFPSCTWLNAVLYLQKKNAMWSGNFNSYDKYYQWYAMVSDGLSFMRGCASSNGTSSGPTGDGDYGWDFDGTFGDWYGGHEVIHTFGIPHTIGGPVVPDKNCGLESEGGSAYKQNTNGWISPTINTLSSQAVFGFDSARLDKKQNPILGPNWRDVMTYCDYMWISDQTYKQLMILLQVSFGGSPLAEQQVVPLAAMLEDRLGVTGTLYPDQKRGDIYPGQVFAQAADSEPRVPGPFNLVLLDGSGNTLARHAFTPELLDMGFPAGEDPADSALHFSELVPYHPLTEQVAVVGPDGSVWASRSAGLQAPALNILSPGRGDIVDTPEMAVTWDATDPDGDPVTVNVEYSRDNGASWNAVGFFLTGGSAVIPADNLPSGGTALLRLTASDGIHSTTRVMTGSFTVPNHTPEVTIVSPASGDVLASGQTLSLEGFAYDIDAGTLDDGALTWTSNVDGILGSGSSLTLTALSQGTHTLTLTADDGQGGTAEASVSIQVVRSPDDLPALPDGLVASPERIVLEPSGGLSSAMISLENQNPAALPWSLVSGKPAWLNLSAASGTTPQDLQLTLDMGLLQPGRYSAALTFASRAGLPRQTVEVEVLIPEFRVHVPLVRR